MKALLTNSALAGSFLMAALMPLSAVAPRASSAVIQQTASTDEETYAQVLTIAEQARIALRANRQFEASELIQSAIKLAPKDDVTRAAIYNVFGNVLAGETYYQLAISQYEQGLKILSGSKDHDFDAVRRALQRLAYERKGITASDIALSADLEFIEIKDLAALKKRSTGLQELSATLLINNGNVYVRQDQYRQADGLYESAMQAARDASLNWLHRRASSNLAWSAIQQGRTAEADKLLGALLKDVSPSTSIVELRRTLLAVAVRLKADKKYSEAIKRFEQVLPLYKTANDLKGLARATAHFAATYLAAGDPASAKTLLTKVVSDSSEHLDPEINRNVHATLAQANWRLRDLQAALRHFQIYLEQIEGISSRLSTEEGVLSFRETQDEFLEDYVRTAFALAEREKNYVIARDAIERIRARSLFSLAEARPSWYSPSPGQIGAKSLLYNGLARYRTQAPDGTVGIEPIPQLTQIDSNSPLQLPPSVQIEKSFGECETPATNQAETKTVATSPETTKASPVAVIEYYVLKDQTVVVVKNRDGKVSGISFPIGESKLTELIDAYVQTLDVANRRGVKVIKDIKSAATSRPAGSEQQMAEKLYDLLIRPVRGFLPSRADEQVVIVPHRALWYLPFAALAPRTGTRMIDEFLLAYAASEETWKLTASRLRTHNHQNARAWIVGNPTISGGVSVCGSLVEFADLPGARQEAEDIARLFGKERTELFTGAQADRLRFEAWYPDFGVIHLAAHGVACPSHPFDSSIMLARVDGASVKIDGVPNDPIPLPPAGPITPPTGPLPPPTGTMMPPTGPLPPPTGPMMPPTGPLPPPTGPMMPPTGPPFTGSMPKTLGGASTATLTLRDDERFPITVCGLPPMGLLEKPAYFAGELPASAVISRYRLNADLVTLSACQTGLGATLGEGMIGFTRAFQVAGARTLVVSLWSVSDDATRDLMVEFYSEYLKHGNKAVALRKAMLSTRQKYPHPRMWAAFSLFGAAE